MLSLLTLPPLPYIIFELLRYKQEDVLPDNQLVKEPESLDIIVMDVLPSQINYSFSGKNGYNVGIGDDNVTVIKGGEAPRKISLQGTFGYRMITRGLNGLDGFGRLKQFEKMFRKSQSLNGALSNNKPDAFSYIYGMNFYDFTHLHWEAVNLDSFTINKNAHVNTQLPSYTIGMTGLGGIVSATPKDPLLRNLKMAILVQQQLEQWNNDLDEFVDSSPFLSGVEEVIADIETLQFAMNAVEQMSGQYGAMLNSGAQSLSRLLNNVPTASGGMFSFANLLGG